MWVSGLYFMVQWFNLEDIWMDECCTGDIDIAWQENWPEAIYVGQWPIFHGPVILSCILKTIWWANVITGILDPCDKTFYLITCMWVSDFMVQWFCVISWRPFDSGMLYWSYWFSVTLTLSYKYMFRWVIYISWFCDSALYLEYYLMNNPHFWILVQCHMGHWPVFHDLAILNYFPISAYSHDSFLLKFDMKMFVNVARSEIGHWFILGTRWGHSCTLDTFLVYI